MNTQKLIAKSTNRLLGGASKAVLLAAAIGAAGAMVAPPAVAHDKINLKVQWSYGTAFGTTGSGAPTFTSNTSGVSSSFDQTPQSDPFTIDDLTLKGSSSTNALFVAAPKVSESGTGKQAAYIPVNFTLTAYATSNNANLGSTSFTDYLDFYAGARYASNNPDKGTKAFDDDAWLTSTPAGNAGPQTSGSITNQPITISTSDGGDIGLDVSLPYTTDWNIDQAFTVSYASYPPGPTVPEPASMVLFASSLLGLPWLRRRLGRKPGAATAAA
jgi:hypothetical protein